MLNWLTSLTCSASNAASVCLPPLMLALETLTLVLRNSLLCIAVGWVFSYCFTVGNVFTGLPPGQQSYANFSAANIAWFYGVFSTCVVILMATKLLPEQFVGRPPSQVLAASHMARPVNRRLNILQCTTKLLARVAPHIVLSAVVVVGGDFAMYSNVPSSWHRFKPCVYIAAFWGFYIMVIADVFVRHIFQTETVRGLLASRQAPRSPAKNQSSTLNPGDAIHHNDVMIQQHNHRRHWKPPFRRFLNVYARNLPVMFFALIAIVYVHAISQFVTLHGQWQLLAFASASIGLKLLLQELAKHIMVTTRRPVSRRVMVILVATPTILVDTQVRMLLLRQANTNVSVAGTVLFAVFKIVVRAAKAFIIQRQTRGSPIARDMTGRLSTFSSAPPRLTTKNYTNAVQVVPAPKPESTKRVRSGTASMKARRDAEEHRRKCRALYAAEIYSDMYAEYIAIGCSYAILFFYHNHPHFQFSLLLSASSSSRYDSNGSVENSMALRERQMRYMSGLQMGVEVVVDFLACALEAAEGVEFKSFDQNDPFLVFYLALLSFANVAISAGLYMR
ncbi:hypothetical protein ON010_g5309 [Phytophthora cinnamomi]|nr:hypothetical protein ON010_g5309 [Phytophthora cinnamomi]